MPVSSFKLIKQRLTETLSFIMMRRDLLTRVGVGIPHLSQVHVMPLYFYERPTLVPVLICILKGRGSPTWLHIRIIREAFTEILEPPSHSHRIKFCSSEGGDLGIGIFKRSLGDSNMQPRLKPKLLVQRMKQQQQKIDFQ